MDRLYKIGITHGDIGGIGYEVIMKALADNKMLELCTPLIYGLSKVAVQNKKLIDAGDFNFQLVKSVEQLSVKKVNLLNISEKEVQFDFGTNNAMAGRLSELSLNMACKDLKDNKIDAIVTAPINKDNIQSETFKFHGHTEYFAHQFKASNVMMMMVADNLRLAFVTHHLPLQEVSAVLSVDLIYNKLALLNKTLKTDFACTNPRIAVLALNPHAGDNGLIGKEEKELIHPAIQKAFDNKINAFGPFPADGFFAAEKYRQFDAVLAMYHDQGMIPFKLLSHGEGVNYTAGLPVVRTSPAHGTAYDIAGKNMADGQSFRNAIYLAIDVLRNRQRLTEE
ncbi:MAG: 4-hydroxythreonine-4-phosphate dehydrogenase PdxA [Bacteroidales bacterium]|nr:4-hydroxythreonine-4-phosphate dehydrogenase PdxA [Bacteroidales bacterium]